MLHIGLQVKDKEELDKVEALLKEYIGILPPLEFDKEKSGIYFMSINPIETKTINDFSDEEIKNEYDDRDLFVY